MELRYFDICSGALVPDVLHDVLEGGLQYEAKLLLQHCIISQGYFTLDELNQLIQYYELGYMESDRPSTINSDKRRSTDNLLKQTGAIQVCMNTIVSVVSSHACLYSNHSLAMLKLHDDGVVSCVHAGYSALSSSSLYALMY